MPQLVNLSTLSGLDTVHDFARPPKTGKKPKNPNGSKAKKSSKQIAAAKKTLEEANRRRGKKSVEPATRRGMKNLSPAAQMKLAKKNSQQQARLSAAPKPAKPKGKSGAEGLRDYWNKRSQSDPASIAHRKAQATATKSLAQRVSPQARAQAHAQYEAWRKTQMKARQSRVATAIKFVRQLFKKMKA